LVLAALISFLLNLKSELVRKIPWRRLLLWSAWVCAAFLAALALSPGRLLNQYQTSIPFKIMMATLGIGSLLGAALYFAVIVLLFGVAYFFALSAFGEEELPKWTGMPGAYYRDALMTGAGGALGLLGLARAVRAVAALWPVAHRAADAAFGTTFDALLPGALVLAEALQNALRFTAIVCLAGAFVAVRVRQTSVRVALFVLGAAALVGTNWGSGSDFVRQAVAQAILLGAVVMGIRYVARCNLMAYFLAIAFMGIFAGMAELLAQPDAFYRANGYACLAGLLLLLAWPFAAWLRGPRPAAA